MKFEQINKTLPKVRTMRRELQMMIYPKLSTSFLIDEVFQRFQNKNKPKLQG